MARPENAGFLGRSGPCPRNASDKRQASPADPKRRSTAQPFDRSHAPAWERHPDAPASPNRQHPSPGGVLFFACPKKRTRRVVCATPLRKGSPAAETTPVDGLRNRRGKNSLRSNSLPLFPGSAPRRPAQRQRAVCFPGDPSCREPSSWRGQRSSSRLGGTITCLSAPSHPSPAGWPVAVGAGHARDGVASVTFSNRASNVSALTFRVPPFRVARERNP